MNNRAPLPAARPLRGFVLLSAWLIPAAVVCGQGLNYVDASHEDFFNDVATPANLFVAPAGSPDGSGAAIAGILSDDGIRDSANGLWDYNANNGGANLVPGSAGTVYTAGDPNADPFVGEDAAELGMRVPGLAASTSYDIFVVYWSTPDSDWSIRAGFTPDPGNNQVFNVGGPTDFAPSAIAGNLATAAIWDTPPPSNFGSGTTFTDDGRSMYIGLVGSATSTAGGTLDVFIDDLPTLSTDGGVEDPGRDTSNRTWFDGIAYIETGNNPILTASIDRTTGELSIDNNLGTSITFDSYSVTSASGALAPASWDSINGGNTIDGDPWTITAPVGAPSAADTLAEQEDAAGGGSGATLADGSSFDLGAVWIRNPTEDVQITLNLVGGGTFTVTPSYTNGDQALDGDFDFDGDIDEVDYAHLMGNMFASSVGLTVAEAYTFGDVTGDLAINFEDHVEFQALFDGFNGAGAFQAMIAAVPEPTSAAIGVTLLLAAGARGRRRW